MGAVTLTKSSGMKRLRETGDGTTAATTASIRRYSTVFWPLLSFVIYTNSGTTLKFTASMMPRSVIFSSGMGGSVKNDIAM